MCLNSPAWMACRGGSCTWQLEDVSLCCLVSQVLLAVANGAWLLTPEWVTASLEAGQWLPEPPFEAKVADPAVLLCMHAEDGCHELLM